MARNKVNSLRFRCSLVGGLLCGCLSFNACVAEPADLAQPPQAAGSEKPENDPQQPDAPAKAAPSKAASQKKGGDPKRQTSEKKDKNRLAGETSPYLLLHAHNPVDWYPWGPEALAKAKKENKLIFLSIGYSSCHWCHVMERESFMDEEIAAYLNENYVCIKVDREERPDIDSIYMTSLHVFNRLSGSGRGGGWPLSMFLTPAAEPFFGGTYFPARDGDRGFATGFLTIIKGIQKVWKANPDRVEQDAKTLTRFVKTELSGTRADALAKLDEELLDGVMESLQDQYDERYGGFGFDPTSDLRPKFPEPSNLMFLLDRVRRTGDDEAKAMLVNTLEKMAMGGIHDHLGGGFHRYSVDRFWRIPHFEKMLYDNGQLASVYAEAYALTGNEWFREITEHLLAFVRRELVAPEGGFYSALDAESEGEEGKFHRWTREEVQVALTEEEFSLFASVYGFGGEPNFEDEFYVPQLSVSLPTRAEQQGETLAELQKQLQPIREKLLTVRNKRQRPLTDTKILTAWNGLMIRGFADAGRLLENESYVATAARAAEFVLKNLQRPDGRLYRTYGDGEAKLNAYLDDYAFLADGLIALFKATGDEKWLQLAEKLTAKQLELFWDENRGGFYFTSDDHETLLARMKNLVDSALPAGNSVAAANLVFLADALEKEEYLEKAEGTVRAGLSLLQNSPAAVPRLAVAAARLLHDK